MEDKRRLATITVIGYFWFSMTALWTIFEIIEASFDVLSTLCIAGKFDFRWLVITGIIILSCITSWLLYRFYPMFIEGLFMRKPEKERYLNLPPKEELVYSSLLINSNLYYLPDEFHLLDPISYMISSNQFERASKYGVWSSTVFLRMSNHLVRVLNGLYTLTAVEMWKQNQSSTDLDTLEYIECFIRTNDLGWSFYKLSRLQSEKLVNYLHEKPELDHLNLLHYSNMNCANIAKENLLQLKERLSAKGKFVALICQILRHLLGLEHHISHEEYQIYFQDLRSYIPKIKNKKDRGEMEANLNYLNVKNACEVARSIEQLKEALKLAGNVQKAYLDLEDEARWVKCFEVIGEIYEELSQKYKDPDIQNDYKIKALKQFLQGASESEHMGRYDEFLDNCLHIAKLGSISQRDSHEYEIRGLRIARLVKNDKMALAFELLHKSKHVILLRHGESEKNLNKVINGNGSLTEVGRKAIEKRAIEINHYLLDHEIPLENVKVFGQDKKQIRESMEIIEQNIDGVDLVFDERLKPTNLGELSNKSEKELIGLPSYNELERWRNRAISIKDLHILNMEQPSIFWRRAESFISEIQDTTSCAIIVCTTSVAILLTHYLLGNDTKSDKYICIDVPLAGMIHFRNDFGKYELCNRDHYTNILFSKLESEEVS